MDNDNNNDSRIENSLTGMEKPCKLFITIDKEGFLMDSVSISDVVNFDCYESITRSAKRIIALFSNSKPDDIFIVALFYYKKRARSTRMNPVPLVTTTDGFRAVAEHPSGEVPLGIDWMKKVSGKTTDTILVKTETDITNDNTVEKVESSVLKLRNKETRRESPSIPEKKPKLDSANHYKTYMPPASKTTTTVEEIVCTPDYMWTQSIKATPPTDVDEVKKSTSALRSSKVNYHWAENVTCEVVFSYDGVSERRKLSPDLSDIVHSMVKGDFSSLKPEVQRKVFNGEGNIQVPDRVAQDLINDANQNFPPNDKTKSIKFFSDAKLEIFRVLSLLQLSKARFKDLLDWMKTLKLEEGKQGKFYLSERNVVGSGLRVNYDTDEQAVARLNQIHKSRLKSNQNNKVLHAVPTQRTYSASKTEIVMPTPVVTDKSDSYARPIMLMMPTSSSNVVTTSAVPTTVPGGQQSLIPLTVLPPPGQQTAPVSSTDPSKNTFSAGTQTFIVKNSASRGVSLLTSSATSTSTTTKQADQSPNRTRKVPNILGNKSSSNSRKPTSLSDEPVPIGLYRSVNKSSRLENDNINHPDPTLPIIKQEPMDTNGDTSCDFDKPSDEESTEGYNHLLKSDDRMLLAVDNPELDMELVIKTEPLDDY